MNNVDFIFNNNPHVVETYLKLEAVSKELISQEQRTDMRYQKIACCCALVVVVATIITCVAVGVPFICMIPTTVNGIIIAGFRETAVGIIFFTIGGSILGSIGTGCTATTVCEMKRREKLKELVLLREHIRQGLRPGDRLDKERLYKVLKVADNHALNTFIPQMDIQQLCTAWKALGSRKLKKLLDDHPENNQNQFQFWRDLLSLASCTTVDELNRIMHRLSILENQKKYSNFKSTAFEIIRENSSPKILVEAAYRWTILSSNNTLAEAQDETQIGITLKQGNLQEKIYVSRNLLTQNSNFFHTALSEDAMKWGDDLDHPLEVEDINAFKETIKYLDPRNSKGEIDKKAMMSVISCAFKYFDRFADNLLLTFSQKELVDMSTSHHYIKHCLRQRSVNYT